MPETCFICLQSCSRKVCFVCSCYAHPKCWKEYQSKLSSKICPVCKTDNIVKPYNTRSKSTFYKTEIVTALIKELGIQLDPRKYVIDKIQELISDVKHISSHNKNLKIEKIEKIMYWVLAGSKYDDSTNLLVYDNFVNVVSTRLISFKESGWSNAEKWHNLLLGRTI